MKLFLISTLLWMLSRVPPRRAGLLARPLAALLWRVAKRLRRVSLKNLELCYPHMDRAARRMLARQAMVHYVRNFMDAGIQWYWPMQRVTALFEPEVGLEHLQAARALGNGVLVLTPHMGAWELMPLRINAFLNGSILFKPSDNPGLDRKIMAKRERMGIRMVPANRQGLKTIYRDLGNGLGACILPDQEPKAGEGGFAPFFGVPARTGVLASRLLQKTGAAAVFVVCLRRPGGRYRLHILPAETALYDANLDTSLAALNRGVEDCIALDPQQYLWAYKRFGARPEGQARLY